MANSKGQSFSVEHKGSGAFLRQLPSLLVAALLFALFAFSSQSNFDQARAQAHSEWRIGIGPAHWLSLARQGSGVHPDIEWQAFEVDFHPGWATLAVALALLAVGLLRRRSVQRLGLNLGQALEQALRPCGQRLAPLAWPVARLGHIALSASMAGLAAALAFNLLWPIPISYTIELRDAGAAHRVQEQIEPRLEEQLPGFSIRRAEAPEPQAALVIEGRRHLYAINHDLIDLIPRGELMAGSSHRFQQSPHPATVPLGVLTAALFLLIHLLRERKRTTQPT
ncbi:hypothetical protein [Wenzhouxiangella marina]|uniref:Uncharacterized protein n=1 Tax=Wenzhouxiangella marina TaxID=1579979 RepID=A0A0K0XYW9_9GAMM|nr:hypothetical protein [Wenzhouxiangella marina]AKS42883.1 hypothetical protein WM2015_2525 [Wenzhouxiangella marina]MBB6087434.1 hypothetical protein [Wenzhouxiangella marina]